MKKLFPILFFLLSLVGNAQLQINQVDSFPELDSMIQRLIGKGVSISNLKTNLNPNEYLQIGYLQDTTSTLPIKSGFLLTSGSVEYAQGPNDSTKTSYSGNVINDQDSLMASLFGVTLTDIYDLCFIEFDITAQGNAISFDYIFASEEYNEFVNSGFNDVFGFFVSGPNPNGGNYLNKNIALVPGTQLPVAINNVNNGRSPISNAVAIGPCTNCKYYSDNRDTLNPAFSVWEYDGYTAYWDSTLTTPIQKPFRAFLEVVCGATYTLRIAITDIGDWLYDSGILLKEGSFNVLQANVSTQSSVSYLKNAYEGCNDQNLILKRPDCSSAANDTLSVRLSYLGQAQNGIDYVLADSLPKKLPLPASYKILPQQDSIVIPISFVYDSVMEGPEFIIINPTLGPGSTSQKGDTIIINDYIIFPEQKDVSMCGDSAASISFDSSFYSLANVFNWQDPSLVKKESWNSGNYTAEIVVDSTTDLLVQYQDTISQCFAWDTITVYKWSGISGDTACKEERVRIDVPTLSPDANFYWPDRPGKIAVATDNDLIVAADTTSWYPVEISLTGCAFYDSAKVFISYLELPDTLIKPACFGDTIDFDLGSLGIDSAEWSLWSTYSALGYQVEIVASHSVSEFSIFTNQNIPSEQDQSQGLIFNFLAYDRIANDKYCPYPIIPIIRTTPNLSFQMDRNFKDTELQTGFTLDYDFQGDRSDKTSANWKIRSESLNEEVDSYDLDYLLESEGLYQLDFSLHSELFYKDSSLLICKKTFSESIQVQDFKTYNVITPNGDGHNDQLIFDGKTTGVWKLYIYNRHGKLVANYENYQNDFSAEQLSAGIYFFTFEDTGFPGRSHNGYLHIVK